ncbi:MAG: ATP-binding protein [Candidatus Fimivivens sp.]
MKIKANITLWGSFVISVFLIMSFSAFVTTGAFVMMARQGWIKMSRPSPFMPLISFLFTSVLVGTIVSVLVGHKITQPIKRLSEALKEIARGNFDVRVSTAKWLPEGRQMVRNFNAMAQELGSIETLRNDFVVNVSHEFKTPIAAIEGYATLLQDGGLTDADQAEYSRLIIESTQQLSALTGNILTLSKLENQQIVPRKQYFALDEQLRQVLLLLEGQWEKKAIELDIELMPVLFHGSEELLHQVWLNILGNAIKFTPHNGTVSVRLFERENQVTVTVSDTGIGISPQMQSRIFEKFYQGNHARTIEGNGLGLALAKRIITLCGGDIFVKSDIGKGACFTVMLPNPKK